MSASPKNEAATPRKWLQDVALLVLVNAAGLAAAWSQSAERIRIDAATRRWTLPSDALLAATDMLAWCGLPTAIVVAAFALARRRWLLLALTFVTGGLWLWLMIALGFLGSTSYIGDARVKAADGRTYAVLVTGFQDYLYWLGRVESPPDAALDVQALARTDDFAAPTVRLVRPKGAPEKAGGLRRSTDGRYVVLEIWDGCGSLILDTMSNEIWGPGPGGFDDVDKTTTPISEASPFVLLGPDDEPNRDDIARLRAGDPGRCRDSKRLDELSPAQREHANPAVRALFE